MATAASTASRARWLRALRWPTFRRVWSAATLQQFGYWFSSIALQWLAGVLADVRDRRRILLSTQLAILLISTTTAVLAHLGRAPVWTLMAGGRARDRRRCAHRRQRQCRIVVGVRRPRAGVDRRAAPARRRPAPVGSPSGGERAGIRSGWPHAGSHPAAGIALATVAVTSVLAASYLAQTPVLADLVSDDPRAFRR